MNASQLFDELSSGLKVQKSVVFPMFEKIDASGEDSILKSFAEVCVFKCYLHPDWAVLAGRAEILRLRCVTPEKFSDVVRSNKKMFLESYATFVLENAEKLDGIIKEDRDMKFDWMAINTLEKSYLLKKKGYDGNLHLNERPQQLYLRVATFLCSPSIPNIRKCYNCLSKGRFTMASPTLFNSGLKKHSLSSCFLGVVQDSLIKMTEEWKNIAVISAGSGGLGYSVTPVRNSDIGDIGKSSGVIPFLRVPNAILGYVDQAGRRKGSGTFFLACWHVDVFEFVEAKKPGGDDLMKAREIFYAIWASDLFMKRVRDNAQWSLFCPNEAPGLDEVYGRDFETLYERYEKEGRAKKTVKAQELWHHILVAQVEVGMPFIAYKDAVCRKSNQKNFGMPHSLNLCVAGDTCILTREKGQVEIESIVDENVHVWNGEEWSETKIVRTAKNQNLLCVEFSNGASIQCTPQHRFFVQDGESIVERRAQELCSGDVLEKWKLPEAFDFEYSLSVTERAQKFEELCERRGRVVDGRLEVDEQGASELRLMLQTLGVESRTTSPWTLVLDAEEVHKLVKLGFSPKYLECPKKAPGNSFPEVSVLSVSKGRQGVDTFCFKEEKKGKGMFGGLLLGNCMEICQNTSEEEIASCNLATICLPEYVKEGKYDLKKLAKNVRKAVRVLNSVIDRNYYPPEIPKIKTTNLKHRPIGLGVQGLADVFALMDISWLDEKAKVLNRQIFETVYHAAITESRKMAKERANFGCSIPYYETFPGSPLSKGFFSHDLWDVENIHKETGIPFDDITIEQVREHRKKRGIPESYCDIDWEKERSKLKSMESTTVS
ncbi:ribonucleotide reductase large subunit [Tunisvirus fontaine2]|uniref:Ribonucleoside-diphosphate reductase n=1 Tax=Tunisvirus fontaine2 TaxID=1421067 RepID=V9SG20_9VIRU|nr:ribonucleotide reductase large subunit [Tunisvirus fontaine2]AHC54834.1 ribonucleoside-diphosphate reductase large chain [Tunisvirus fontaine2]